MEISKDRCPVHEELHWTVFPISWKKQGLYPINRVVFFNRVARCDLIVFYKRIFISDILGLILKRG